MHNNEIPLVWFLLPLISLIAFFLKGMTGTGTSTVVIALASLLVGPKTAVVLASFMNMFGGLSMIKVDPVPLKSRYWVPIAAGMVGGSVLGAALLKVISAGHFQLLLGVVFFLTSGWFFLKPPVADGASSSPARANALDVAVGVFAGFCGGFVGVNAPPLVTYAGKHLNKRLLRRLLVLIFIPAAVAQTATFAVNGLLTREVFLYGLLMLPGMILGIYLGNKSFQKVSEKQFRRILAAFLLVVSGCLIFEGLKP
jgi:uncharacterized membrane protein YfcA